MPDTLETDKHIVIAETIQPVIGDVGYFIRQLPLALRFLAHHFEYLIEKSMRSPQKTVHKREYRRWYKLSNFDLALKHIRELGWEVVEKRLNGFKSAHEAWTVFMNHWDCR